MNKANTHVVKRILRLTALGVFLCACATASSPPAARSTLVLDHVLPAPQKLALAPVPVIPSLKWWGVAATDPELFDISVKDVPLKDLFLALGRLGNYRVGVSADVVGTVTLQAKSVTFDQLLTHIAQVAAVQYQIQGREVVVRPSAPHWQVYSIDYINTARVSQSAITIATQIAAGTGGVVGGNLSNNSTTQVSSSATYDLWQGLTEGISRLLDKNPIRSRPVPRATPAATQPADNSPVIAAAPVQSLTVDQRIAIHREAGIIEVFAAPNEQKRVKDFIDAVLASAKRQVFLEVTVAEVQLSEQHQQGINWQTLSTDPSTDFNLIVKPSSGGLNGTPSNSFLSLGYANANSWFGNVSATLLALQSFGVVKVLSSPRLATLNNQTAILKVVDHKVFFTLEASTNNVSGANNSTTRYSSRVNTVPVGLVITITPQIAANGRVMLSARPSISRIIGYTNDPNPDLAAAKVINPVPEIQTREMESVLELENGQIAVMGGLMQESVNDNQDQVPSMVNARWWGWLFGQQVKAKSQSELVIFLRPTLIKNSHMRSITERIWKNS